MPKVYKDRNRILHFTTVIFKINSPSCIKKKEWKIYIYNCTMKKLWILWS